MESSGQSLQSTVSLREAVGLVIAEMNGPISRSELIARVSQRHVSHARRPEDLILAETRQRQEIVRLDDGLFASREWVLNGFVFRYALSAEEIQTGEIALFPCFTPFLPPPASPPTPGAALRIVLREEATGAPVVTKDLAARWGTVGLKSWLAGRGAASGDSLVLTVADPSRAVFLARLEAASDTDLAAVDAQDTLLEETLFDLVAKNASEQPFLEEIIPAALARLSRNARACPGSHWHQVVAKSPRLRVVDNYALARATFRRPIDRLMGYAAPATARENLETRIDALNADLTQTLGEIGARTALKSPASSLCGRDEALHRSTRQIAAYLATLPSKQEDCYRCLAIPSIYLAKHEGTSLADADFDMLCRFLLSYYPRRVFFNRKSFTSRMLTTLRHFYAQTQARRTPALVTPHHLSRLHRLVDRKIALYAELDMDGPDSQRLFGKLFPEVDADDAEMLPLTADELVLAAR